MPVWPDLLGVRAPACVDDGAGGAYGCAESFGEGHDEAFESFRAADAAATGYDYVGVAERDAGALLGADVGGLHARGLHFEFKLELLAGRLRAEPRERMRPA